MAKTTAISLSYPAGNGHSLSSLEPYSRDHEVARNDHIQCEVNESATAPRMNVEAVRQFLQSMHQSAQYVFEV